MRGLGITVLPAFIVAQELQQGTLQRVLPDYQASELAISVIYPVNRHLSTKVRLLTDFLQERFWSAWMRRLPPFSVALIPSIDLNQICLNLVCLNLVCLN